MSRFRNAPVSLRRILRGLLPLSRSRLRGGRREAKAQVKVEVKVKSSASESHDEACSLSKGTPLLQQITLRDNGAPL